MIKLCNESMLLKVVYYGSASQELEESLQWLRSQWGTCSGAVRHGLGG